MPRFPLVIASRLGIFDLMAFTIPRFFNYPFNRRPVYNTISYFSVVSGSRDAFELDRQWRNSLSCIPKDISEAKLAPGVAWNDI